MSLVHCPFEESVVRRVTYGCSCGSRQPISRLYFCRHCLDTRCPFCVSHEVDSHYCPNCLENMPSAEARLKRNRCANCFDCPMCSHTVSTRATSVQVPSAEDPSKTVPKKVYYLCCNFCRWTSRDIGLPDQNVASGGWPDRENPHAARLSVLQDYYRAVAQREKVDKESKRFVGRKLSYMQLSDKYGLTSSMARRRMLESPCGSQPKQAEMAPAEAKAIEEVETLDEDALFETETDLCQVTTLTQRLLLVDTQPSAVSEVFPRHKHLMIKRSQRCRKCEHNLSKPEYNPSSVKFKIQLAAFYHVPEVVIATINKAGDVYEFVLKIVNPTQHQTKIDLMPLGEAKQILEKREEEQAREEDAKKKSSSVLRGSSQVSASEHRRRISVNAECKVRVHGILVPPRDDAAEFDEPGPGSSGPEDSDFVVWRRGNRVGVRMAAQLGPDLVPGSEITAAFGMRFVYTNTISALEQREVQTAEVLVPVYVVLGSL